MNTDLDHTAKESPGSSSDSHHELPVLAPDIASSSNRRHTASSDGTRAPEDDVSKGEKAAPVQTAVAAQGSTSRGPPYRKFGHKCK